VHHLAWRQARCAQQKSRHERRRRTKTTAGKDGGYRRVKRKATWQRLAKTRRLFNIISLKWALAYEAGEEEEAKISNK